MREGGRVNKASSDLHLVTTVAFSARSYTGLRKGGHEKFFHVTGGNIIMFVCVCVWPVNKNG